MNRFPTAGAMNLEQEEFWSGNGWKSQTKWYAEPC